MRYRSVISPDTDQFHAVASQFADYDRLEMVETVMTALQDAIRQMKKLADGSDDYDDDIETLEKIHDSFDRFRDRLLEKLYDDVLEAVNG